MSICDIYCRSATQDEDTEVKLQQQEADCRAYCAKHGLTVGLVMHEVANGSTYKGRPSLDLLRARYQNGITKGIVVVHRDRIVRNPEQFFSFMQEIERCHAKLYCASDELESDPIVRFLRICEQQAWWPK